MGSHIVSHVPRHIPVCALACIAFALGPNMCGAILCASYAWGVLASS